MRISVFTAEAFLNILLAPESHRAFVVTFHFLLTAAQKPGYTDSVMREGALLNSTVSFLTVDVLLKDQHCPQFLIRNCCIKNIELQIRIGLLSGFKASYLGSSLL